MAVKSLMIPVKPSAKYAFSGWMKTRFEKGGEPRAYFFFVGYKNGKLVKQLQNTTIVKATTDWTEYKLNVRFGANIDAIVIHAVIAPGPGTIWLDDVSFSQLSAGAGTPPDKHGEGNLIKNGDFELDADNNGIPDNWRTRNPATATWTTEYASSGKRCIKVAKDGYWMQGDLPVVPGRRMCTVSFNAMTDKFGQRMRVYCEANRGGRFLMLGTFTDRGEGNRAWHKKKFTFRMPDPAVVDRFYIVLMALDGTVWFDDVKISMLPEEVAQAPTSALEIELTKPYWRNTIYATETVAKIVGRVIFNEEHADGECVVAIEDSTGRMLLQNSISCTSRDKAVTFKFPARTLRIGEYRIRASFKGTDAKKLVATAPLRRLRYSGGEIRVREDNVLLINGKPFFPIGLWPAGNYGEIAAAGFNWVKCGNPDAKVPSAFKAHLKKMRKYGLRGGVELYIYTELKNSKETAESIKRGIANVRDNATFLGWYVDEAVLAGLPPEYARTMYEAVRKNDPHHLLWTSHAPRNTIAEIAAWNKYMDMTWCNIYPYPDVLHSDLPNQTIGVVGDETRKQRETVNDRKPVWMNLQGFIWEGRPAPTWQATRFMAYDAVINGAKGVIWYNTHQIPRPGPFWSSIKRTAGQLRDISAVLVSPDVKTALRIDGTEPDQIRYLLKKCEGSVYLLAENRTAGKLSVSITGIPTTEGSLKVLFEDRRIPVKKGVFNDTFAPWDIHIYTDAKALPKPLVPPTPAALQYAKDEKKLAQLIAEGWVSRKWDAAWIWYPGQLKTDNLVVYARKKIRLDAKPETAWVQIAVDDGYVLHVNGKQIKAGGWGHAYDIARYLRTGDNVIAIKGINGITYAGILVQGVIGSGKERERVITDSSWRVSLIPDKGWTESSFDDSAWKAAYSIGKPPIKPWKSVPVYLGATGN